MLSWGRRARADLELALFFALFLAERLSSWRQLKTSTKLAQDDEKKRHCRWRRLGRTFEPPPSRNLLELMLSSWC